jgi:hypothetical protein
MVPKVLRRSRKSGIVGHVVHDIQVNFTTMRPDLAHQVLEMAPFVPSESQAGRIVLFDASQAIRLRAYAVWVVGLDRRPRRGCLVGIILPMIQL